MSETKRVVELDGSDPLNDIDPQTPIMHARFEAPATLAEPDLQVVKAVQEYRQSGEGEDVIEFRRKVRGLFEHGRD